ncbi:GlxA family transcriptional regulator [Nocardioides sp. Soil805]|uniref:GlxA family transcriptional regulator n=1 Tax=Nocardioides sp. Soil805 TaxID=1736416 RepID=UPI0007035151|nr:helix-turn-helix domain-containing protein [Nocardioides sp. Soil805]KRF34510.1 AraC family transcriptional regulator [Nocardioides sp. Soil805]
MTPNRVVVLALGPVVAYDAVIPMQVLGQAVDGEGQGLYDVVLATLDGNPAVTTHGFDMAPHGDQGLIEGADLIVIPGTHSPGPRREGLAPEGLRTALDRRRADARVASICTGAFVLAAVGMLDGRPATTHWSAAEEFRRLYPRVNLDPRVLYVDDGDVLTSAGLSAGVDLCLHLIRSDHGIEIANQAARHMVVAPWRDGGQAQFIESPLPHAPDQSTSGARTWALEHLGERITLQGLADRACMSVRTFNRHFRADTGTTPGSWLIQQRLRQAQRLLESSDLTVDEVAARVGFSAASFRAHLRSTTGISPTAYRSAFRAAE